MSRLLRAASLALLVLGLTLPAPPARAQDTGEAAPTEGGSSGNPLYGYLGVALLGSLSIFVLCKSARR